MAPSQSAWIIGALISHKTQLFPRIDDILDQLGEAQYFVTLDLAAGYIGK